MATSSNDKRPMQQPGPGERGADVGGISQNAEGGLEDAIDHMAERRDADASGAASIGQGAGNSTEPRLDLGGHNEPGDAPASSQPPEPPGTHGASPRRSAGEGTEGEEGGRGMQAGTSMSPAGAAPAEPDAGVPPDQQMAGGSGPPEPAEEGPLESLGRSISEVVIGTLESGDDIDDLANPPTDDANEDAARSAPRARPDEKR